MKILQSDDTLGKKFFLIESIIQDIFTIFISLQMIYTFKGCGILTKTI